MSRRGAPRRPCGTGWIGSEHTLPQVATQRPMLQRSAPCCNAALQRSAPCCNACIAHAAWLHVATGPVGTALHCGPFECNGLVQVIQRAIAALAMVAAARAPPGTRPPTAQDCPPDRVRLAPHRSLCHASFPRLAASTAKAQWAEAHDTTFCFQPAGFVRAAAARVAQERPPCLRRAAPVGARAAGILRQPARLLSYTRSATRKPAC